MGPQVEEILPKISPVSLSIGQELTEPGQESDAVIFPTTGLLSSQVAFANGRQIECLMVGANSAVGAIAAMGFTKALTRTVCLVSGHAWSIPVAALQAAAQQVPAIYSALNRCAVAQMAYALRIGACNSVHPVQPRLARWLLTASSVLQRDQIPVTQDDLAHVLGVQRTSVNPMLHQFQDQGLITIRRGRIEISDAAGFARKACECHPQLQHLLTRP